MESNGLIGLLFCNVRDWWWIGKRQANKGMYYNRANTRIRWMETNYGTKLIYNVQISKRHKFKELIVHSLSIDLFSWLFWRLSAALMALSSLWSNHVLYSWYLANPYSFIRGSIYIRRVFTGNCVLMHSLCLTFSQLQTAICSSRLPISILSATLSLTVMSDPRKSCHCCSVGIKFPIHPRSGSPSFHCSYFYMNSQKIVKTPCS